MAGQLLDGFSTLFIICNFISLQEDFLFKIKFGHQKNTNSLNFSNTVDISVIVPHYKKTREPTRTNFGIQQLQLSNCTALGQCFHCRNCRNYMRHYKHIFKIFILSTIYCILFSPFCLEIYSEQLEFSIICFVSLKGNIERILIQICGKKYGFNFPLSKLLHPTQKYQTAQFW